jgi:hypothetical protein
MTGRGYGDRWWEEDRPADLEKTNAEAATKAASTSKDSYTKTIRMTLVKNKKYRFWFTYKYEDPETKEISFSAASPIWEETFDIPNLTKAVQNLTLTPGLRSYGIKFDVDPLSVQEDVVIFESLTSNFATQNIVYVGTSNSVTIQTDGPNAFAPRWVKVRSRDRYDDLNISEATAGPVTPLNSEINTTIPPGVPTNVLVTPFNEISDPSNYTGYINVSWTAPTTGAKGYNVGVWESTPGTNLPNREFKVDGTSSKIDGLFVGKSYYIQVKSLSEFGTPSAWVAPVLNYPALIPGNTAVPGAVTVSGVGTPRSIVLSWTVPASNADLVVSGGYYIAKIYTNQFGTGSPLETKTCFSNSATFAGLTTGTQYWVTIQAYTGGATPVAGALSSVYGPLVPIAVEPPDIQADFILANNQFQVGGTSGANDIHLSAYTKNVGVDTVTGLPIPTKGRIYIGGPETSASAAVGLYNSNGTPFYADNLGRFSLGDKLTWSGSALNVIGTIDVAGASTFSSYVLAGTTNSTFIGIGRQVPYRVSNVLQSGVNGLTGIVINKSGTVANSDYIKSDGSFRLGEGGLIYNGTQLNLIGNIQAIGGTFTGNVRVTTGSIISGTGQVAQDGSVSGARIVIQQSGLYAHDGVALNDVPTVSIVAATGSLFANKGKIGTWNIEPTGLSSEGGNAKIEGNGTITLGDTTGSLPSVVKLSATDNYRLWVGAQNSQAAAENYFAVSKEGKLYASGAVISGNSTFGGTLTIGTTLSNGATLDSVRIAALQGITDAGAAAQAAAQAKARGDEAYNQAISAGQSATAATNAAQAASEAVTLRLTGAQVAAVLVADTTIINGSTITTGTINLARLNISGGTTPTANGFVVDSSGIRAYKNSTQTVNISSNGTASFGGEINATSGFFGANYSDGFAIIDNAIYGYSSPAGSVPQIIIDAKAGTITGGKLTGALIVGNTITGGTITGSIVQTSTSSTNVKLQNSGVDSLQVTLSGTTVGHLYGVNLSGGAMILQGGSGAPSSTNPGYGRVYVASQVVSVAASASSSILLNGVDETTRIFGSGGIYTDTVGSFYMRSGDTTAATANMQIVSTAGATFGRVARSTSSRRYKTDIETVSYPDESVKLLRPVKYHGIKDIERGDNTWYTGLIAEEVAEIPGLELLVQYNDEGQPEAVNYAGLSVVLAEVVSRILNRLDALEAK